MTRFWTRINPRNTARLCNLFMDLKHLWENPTCPSRLTCPEEHVSSLNKCNPTSNMDSIAYQLTGDLTLCSTAWPDKQLITHYLPFMKASPHKGPLIQKAWCCHVLDPRAAEWRHHDGDRMIQDSVYGPTVFLEFLSDIFKMPSDQWKQVQNC